MKPTKKTTNSLLQEKWWRMPGLLYFIAAGDPPRAIKIGVTTQKTFLQRFRQIQSSNHELLKLMGAIVFNGGEYPMKDCEDEERRLHIQFAHLQRFQPHTRGAEWFSVGKDLLSFIKKSTETSVMLNLPEIVADPL